MMVIKFFATDVNTNMEILFNIDFKTHNLTIEQVDEDTTLIEYSNGWITGRCIVFTESIREFE